MNEPNMALVALNIVTVSILLFSASLLILRHSQNQTYYPLSFSFIATALVLCQPTLKAVVPSLQLPMLVLALPALLLIAPCFWLYVKGLTHSSVWQFSKHDLKHMVVPSLGLIISLITFCLPYEIQFGLLGKGDLTVLDSFSDTLKTITYVLAILTFLLVLGWVLQSAFYLFKILQRLTFYRAKLKEVFASTDNKEFQWLSGLLIFVGLAWGVAALNLIVDNLFSSNGISKQIFGIAVFVMVYVVTAWGLRQKPGFEEIFDTTLSTQTIDTHEYDTVLKASEEKYLRSALTDTYAKAIAQKLESAMVDDQLFLDANLSLPKLAKHIHVSPNYISQTLNETMGTHFFDYVNERRVNEAKTLLQNSNQTVLSIAMQVGFNSKSAFYSAFKKYTQQTPSQFKQQCK